MAVMRPLPFCITLLFAVGWVCGGAGASPLPDARDTFALCEVGAQALLHREEEGGGRPVRWKGIDHGFGFLGAAGLGKRHSISMDQLIGLLQQSHPPGSLARVLHGAGPPPAFLIRGLPKLIHMTVSASVMPAAPAASIACVHFIFALLSIHRFVIPRVCCLTKL